MKKLQQAINQGEQKDSKEVDLRNLEDIQKFDDQKSEANTVKLAYASPAEAYEQLSKDPEYIKQKQQFDELNMLLGNEKSSESSDMMDLLPYMSEQGDKKLSPEVIQAMMMKSMMNGISL